MKIFTKKSILQKTIIVILTVLCINFITPTYSHAGIGGILLDPIVDFFCTIGDVAINVLQKVMSGNWGSIGSFKLFDGGFLVESTEFFSNSSSEYDSIITNEEGEKIKPDDPDDPEGGFNKTLRGNTQDYHIPIATYSPEQIFSGNVAGLDVNFINPNTYKDRDENIILDEDGNNFSSASKLQPTISSWYIALRNLAIVGLLCVLVYVGIRIVLSSTAQDKAKYKQLLMDWLIALCLLFFMHYIMSFTLTLVQSISSAIGGSSDDSVIITIVDENDNTIGSFKTNLLGAARFKTQYNDAGQKITYFLFYMALVAYTAIFTWHYLKRLLMMAFLTIIAPMVALTYPIDKMSDGKAQAFNMWLKEYIYNALVQPFHLIIYTVFVTSAMNLAQTNMLYALACMAFILPAEKFLKKMFGFDRAPLGTMGALTGFTVGSLASKIGKSSGGGKSSVSKSESSSEKKSTRYERHHGTEGIDESKNPALNSSNKGDEEEKEEKTDAEKAKEAADRAAQAFAEAEEKRKQEEERKKQEERARQLAERESELEKEEQEKAKQDAQNKNDFKEPQDKDNENARPFGQGVRNIVSAHGGKKRLALKGVRTLGRGAKFVARTGLKVGGTLAGAGIGLASGQGLAGVIAGAAAGKAIGSRMGDTLDVPGKVAHGVAGAARSVRDFKNRTLDTFDGTTERQDKAEIKAFMKSAETDQYIRDKWTKEHNGNAPTAQELKDEKEIIQKYANEGMTDIAQIYRARKAEKFGISEEQSAKIALLAQDRKITSEVLGDEKKYNARREDFIQEFMDKGLTEEQAVQRSDYVLNVMKAQVGQRHDFGKRSTSAQQKNSNPTPEPTQTKKTRQKPNPNPNPTPVQNARQMPNPKPSPNPKGPTQRRAQNSKPRTSNKGGRKGKK